MGAFRERFTIIVKDVGKAYNPSVMYRTDFSDNIEAEQLGMVLVSVCRWVDGLAGQSADGWTASVVRAFLS